jgi:hypothetical protein
MSNSLMNHTFIIIREQLRGYYAGVENVGNQILFKRSSKLAPVNSTCGPALGGILRAVWSLMVSMRMSHVI